jgi:hypothetical protein
MLFSISWYCGSKKSLIAIHMFGKRSFKNWRTVLWKYEEDPSSWNHASQDRCGIVQCSNIPTHEWLVATASWETVRPMIWSFIMLHHKLTFGVSLCCSTKVADYTKFFSYICSRYHSNDILQLTRTHRVQKSLITANFLQHFLTKSLSTVTVGWFDMLAQLQHLRTQS